MYRNPSTALSVLGMVLLLSWPMPAIATTTLVGVEEARFAWTPASGPVDEYLVNVSVNGQAMRPYAYVDDTSATIQGRFGDSIVVTVAGVARDGQVRSIGPLSDPSEEVRFVQSSLPDPDPTHASGAELILVNANTGELRVWSMGGLEIVDDRHLVTSPGGEANLGDFNGDGLTDVLWRDETTGALAISITGGGIGVLDPGADWVLGPIGDYDGNGRSDLLMRNPVDAAVSSWLLDGPAIVETIDHDFTISSDWQLRSGDFDGDGTDDLLGWSETGELNLTLIVDGSPTSACEGLSFSRCFTRRAINLGEIGVGWQIAAIGDFDADERDDLLLRNSTGDASSWTFDGVELVYNGPLPALGPEWQAVASVDLDGDGADDLLWRDPSGSIEAWLMDGTEIASLGVITTLGDDWHLANIP